MSPRCRSRRIRPLLNWTKIPGPIWLAKTVSYLTPGIVRCSWKSTHVATSKWHCAEESTGHVWYAKDRERKSS